MIPVMILPTLTRHDLALKMLASIDYPVGLLVIVNNHRTPILSLLGVCRGMCWSIGCLICPLIWVWLVHGILV
jgi:hypothetical protein